MLETLCPYRMGSSSMDSNLIKQFFILNQHFYSSLCVAGATYRLRISNVGLKTTINFRIQDHLLLLVETEGSYTLQNFYSSLDVHVGQSYSVLVTAKNQTNGVSFYMVVSSRFTPFELFGIGIIRYPGSEADPFGPLPSGPHPFDYIFSME
ncbi:hypothetical protein CUMW_070540 [Citrus unshiu]|nr:hypothetical protein CUMW_070540 [Citrus unshiu]